MLKKGLCSILVALILVTGCASTMPVSYSRIDNGNYVEISLRSGATVSGEIQARDNDELLILPSGSNLPVRVYRNQIVSLKRKAPVFDDSGKVIPESEIKQRKAGHNRWLYAVGGAALCFGLTFFLTANVVHSAEDEEFGGAELWGPVIGGTLVGGALFSRQGSKADRESAVESIREERKIKALREMDVERLKRLRVQNQIDKLKNERLKQNHEINKLLKEINEKNEEK